MRKKATYNDLASKLDKLNLAIKRWDRKWAMASTKVTSLRGQRRALLTRMARIESGDLAQPVRSFDFAEKGGAK